MPDPENPLSDDLSNRRRAERHPPKVEPTYVWISLDVKLRARVIDESVGGLAIQVEGENDGNFEVGFQVRIQHEGERRTANVVYVTEPENGKYRVGLSWED